MDEKTLNQNLYTTSVHLLSVVTKLLQGLVYCLYYYLWINFSSVHFCLDISPTLQSSKSNVHSYS